MQQTIIIQHLQHFDEAEEGKKFFKKNSEPTVSNVLFKYAKSYNTRIHIQIKGYYYNVGCVID